MTVARRAQYAAEQLRRGERVHDKATHHRAMRLLLTELFGPCPDGHTLSLVDPLSPAAYIGWHSRGEHYGGRNEYVLSTAVADYVWESRDDNRARGLPSLDDDVMRELRAHERAAA